MPKSAEQKTRILTLFDILRTETDAAHPMTEERLRAALASRGVIAERKTVLDDLHALENYGLPIENRRGRGGGYYLDGQLFELAELKLLVDAVQCSKFISEKKSRALIGKLCTLTSRHEAMGLTRQVYVSGRVKTENTAALYAVDAIHSAIAAKTQISFRYNEWTIDKTLRPRRGGALYTVSPYLLTWEDGNYYLVAYEDEKDALKHFRVDKMTNVTQTENRRGGEERFARLDPAGYAKETFGMYGGEETLVTLLCDRSLVGVILDRFGEGVTLIPVGEEQFRVSVRVQVSPVFLAWVIEYGGRMRVTAPDEVCARVRELAESALK